MGDVFLNICWNNSKRELSAFFANATSFYIISISLIIRLFLSPLSASNSLHFLPIFSSYFFHFYNANLISSLCSLPLILSRLSVFISVMSHLFSSFLFSSRLFFFLFFSCFLICSHILFLVYYHFFPSYIF